MGPLDNIRVLDFGRYVAGPYCATLFADFGADVIRIERPGGGEDRGIAPVTADGEGALFLQINRNKRSLTLNPRAPAAGNLMRRLVASADVVVVNVPDSALVRMGLDYEALSAIRPDIILVNMSSFGPVGPWADRPGFDSVGQAMCGSAYLSGPGDVPYRTPVTWVDHATALYAAFGTMVALHERGRTGRGQQVSGSLLGSALAFSSTYLIEQAMLGIDRLPIGNRSYLNGPTDSFRTQDGWIVTQVVGPVIFRRWAELVGEPELAVDPRFATDELRGRNGAILSRKMQAWSAERTTSEALEALGRATVPAGPVLTPRETLEHPQVKAMGFFVPTEIAAAGGEVPLASLPIGLSATPAAITAPPPGIGEQSDQILGELGFAEDEIAALRRSGAI
jgi:crotonobetainyl-CoA:carnitine CoA-transferase CaiB-like acyl-CoA transferase